MKTYPITCAHQIDICFGHIYNVITHSQREAYMDLVENSGGSGHQEIEEPQGM